MEPSFVVKVNYYTNMSKRKRNLKNALRRAVSMSPALYASLLITCWCRYLAQNFATTLPMPFSRYYFELHIQKESKERNIEKYTKSLYTYVINSSKSLQWSRTTRRTSFPLSFIRFSIIGFQILSDSCNTN